MASVTLGRYFDTFVKAQVESGRYNNVSEVVRAGLRLLDDELQGRPRRAAEPAPLGSPEPPSRSEAPHLEISLKDLRKKTRKRLAAAARESDPPA